MGLPSLSVVIANYNHARYLPEALRCIVGQSFRPLEVIVVDDDSSDQSVELVRGFARREPLVKLVRNSRNRGAISTFNRGMRLASGEYVYGAAADDRVLPGFFAEAMEMASRYPQAGIIFGKMAKVDGDQNVLDHFCVTRWKEPIFATPAVFLRDYLTIEAPTHSLSGATIYRRPCLLEVGGNRAELGSWGDTFAIRAIGLRYGACYLPKVVMHWRYSPHSVAHRTTLRQALKIGAQAACLMRSAQFRDYFPESYVRTWEASYRQTLLRWHLLQFPVRRDAIRNDAEELWVRTSTWLRSAAQYPAAQLAFRFFPQLEVGANRLFRRLIEARAEGQMRRDERRLFRLRDPLMQRASLVGLLGDSIPLPARRLSPFRPGEIRHDGQYGYHADLGAVGIFLPSDYESVSQLRLLEDGKLLEHSHSPHEAIRAEGRGRYSHWGNLLYFSASDNSDPRTNRRRYTLCVPQSLLSYLRLLARRARKRCAA